MNSETKPPVGMFKQLRIENWLEADPVMKHFGIRDSHGFRQARAEDWAQSFLNLELSKAVPRNVRDLFEVARGVCLYGWFFYPLYQLGEDQLFRVADVAVAARCEQLGGPKHTAKFAERLAWLRARGVIPEDQAVRWDGLRNLRNIASHPQMQMIHPPGSVLRSFQIAVQRINALFETTQVARGKSPSNSGDVLRDGRVGS